MIFFRNFIFFCLGLLSIITVFFSTFGNEFVFSRLIFSFVFLTFIPGTLALLALKIRFKSRWEFLISSVGVSIFIDIFGSLFCNFVFPFFGISVALTLWPLLATIILISLITGFIAFIRNEDLSFYVPIQRLKKLQVSLIALAALISALPILSVFGALRLNNGGDGMLNIFMLICIWLVFFVLFFNSKKYSDSIFLVAIYSISLALLLMISLRGWYITGHDIQQEYYVFQLTKNNQLWSMSLFRDLYNACLSLNILPTLYSVLMNIDGIYVFKVVFQLLTPFATMAMYLFFRRYTDKRIAFLSVFLFVSFPAYLNDMPMLNRQEIAFIFFSLMLLTLLNENLSKGKRDLLFIIFGAGLVVSHYSTNYTAVVIFSIAYIFSQLLRRDLFLKRLKFINKQKKFLSFRGVSLFLVMTVVWGIFTTPADGGLARRIESVWTAIDKSDYGSSKSLDTSYGILNWGERNLNEIFQSYIESRKVKIKMEGNSDRYYPSETYNDFTYNIQGDELVPLTLLGAFLEERSINVYFIHDLYKNIAAKIIQVFLIVGVLTFVSNSAYRIRKIPTEYHLLTISGIFLVGLMTILPDLSAHYGVLRLFQQMLFLFALPIIAGSITFFGVIRRSKDAITISKSGSYLLMLRLRKRSAEVLSFIFFSVFFLSTSGVIPQLTGGYLPLINTNNFGTRYDCTYTNSQEVFATKWIVSNNSEGKHIQTNECMHFKFLAISAQYASGDFFPFEIERSNYVLLDRFNVQSRKNRFFFNGLSVVSNQPIEFLDENKDMIYYNGSSAIYR